MGEKNRPFTSFGVLTDNCVQPAVAQPESAAHHTPKSQKPLRIFLFGPPSEGAAASMHFFKCLPAALLVLLLGAAHAAAANVFDIPGGLDKSVTPQFILFTVSASSGCHTFMHSQWPIPSCHPDTTTPPCSTTTAPMPTLPNTSPL